MLRHRKKNRCYWIGTFVGVTCLLQVNSANAVPFVLDFEGLGVLQDAAQWGIPTVGVIEGVGDFYNGGTGASGSGPGLDFGVEFSDNALALVDPDAVGLTPISGNFGGEPTPDTVMFFLTGTAATMTYRAGFTDGFSFFYSSISFIGSINVYSGPEAGGDLLASLALPTTPFNGAPDPTGQFSPFIPIGVAFEGVAQSIDFGGTINQIAFDNITFGASAPLDGPSELPGAGKPQPPVAVSEPSVMLLFSVGLLGLGVAGRGRAQRAEKIAVVG